jgi:hypothetical protein
MSQFNSEIVATQKMVKIVTNDIQDNQEHNLTR